MSDLDTLVSQGGRKYAVVILTLRLGALLALAGLLVAAAIPSIAPNVAAIIGSFGLLGSVSVGAYQGAHAAADWHTTPKPEGP